MHKVRYLYVMTLVIGHVTPVANIGSTIWCPIFKSSPCDSFKIEHPYISSGGGLSYLCLQMT